MAVFEKAKALPPHWAEDDFSDAMDQAFNNVLGSFVKLRTEYEICHSVDRSFFRVATNLLQPRDMLAPLFLMRSHSAYRAACQLSMAGQTVEAFPLLRVSLECALYALHINRNEEMGEVWLRRHDDDEKAIKRVRKEFGLGNIFRTLHRCDPHLHSDISPLYERTIDFGGHPNERAITSNMEILRTKNTVEYRQLYLTADSTAIRHAMKTAGQIGLGSLLIFRNIFQDRFDLLGVSIELQKLRQKL